MTNYTFEEIAEKFGEEIARQAMEIEADATSRFIYPAYDPEHAGMIEWAAQGSVKAKNGDMITAYWYLTDDDAENIDFYDWEEKVVFQVKEA